MYKHTAIKPWKCDECDYSHAAKAGIAEHKKYAHAKESDFKICHLCTYKTPGESELKKHIEMVHQKIKRFTCDQCARQFYQNNQLKRHIRGNYLHSIAHLNISVSGLASNLKSSFSKFLIFNVIFLCHHSAESVCS